jgi:hypothetical protein
MDVSGANTNANELKSVRIKRMIEEVTTALLSNSAAVVASQFPSYQTEFPRLFATLLTPDYDRKILDHIVQQFEKMEAGGQSQHQASVAVGSVLVDTYVKGKIVQ